MTDSGQAWALTSSSERRQDLPEVTCPTSANPELGLDPWILTPTTNPAEVPGPPKRPNTPPKLLLPTHCQPCYLSS